MLDLIEDDEPFRGKLSSKEPKSSSYRRGKRGGRGGRGGARQQRGNSFQRVVVKTHSTKIAGKGLARAKAHAKYLERDGVGKDDEPAKSFGKDNAKVDLEAFVDRCADDRHMFRVILSPEAGEDLDLEKYTKDVMKQVEKDLKTDLEWAAVAHYNTDNPHVHIMIRGVDERGKDLFINKDYLTRGMRQRAREVATHQLGPRTQEQVNQAKEREITAERFTSLDRTLLEKSNPITPSPEGTPPKEKAQLEIEAPKADRIVDLRANLSDLTPANLRERKRLLRRICALESMGLAKPTGHNRWKISHDLQAQLKNQALQKDIIRRMYAAKSTNPQQWADPVKQPPPPIGRLVGRGLSDDHKGDEYIIVEGVDGKTHHVDRVKDASESSRPSVGDIVSLHNDGTKGPIVSRIEGRDINASVNYDGPIWLDRELVKGEEPSSANQFARDLKQAIQARRRALKEMGAVQSEAEIPPHLLKIMRARERQAYVHAYALRHDKQAIRLRKNESIRGKVSPIIELKGGKYHLVESAERVALLSSDQTLRKHVGIEARVIIKANQDGRLRSHVRPIEPEKGLER